MNQKFKGFSLGVLPIYFFNRNIKSENRFFIYLYILEGYNNIFLVRKGDLGHPFHSPFSFGTPRSAGLIPAGAELNFC